jgi:hypothetical protein
MFAKLIPAVIALTALVAGTSSMTKAPSAHDCRAAKASVVSCYPGCPTCCDACGTLDCECCFDGSPCCGPDCCPEGAVCCSSNCCAATKAPAKAADCCAGGECCDPPHDCCLSHAKASK